jgi:septum formation protein
MLVLASASPRRQELLSNAGIEFTVQAADIPENPLLDEPPRSFAERMAREKALAVFRGRPSDVVLGADTIVVVDGQILGKPRDPTDAVRMLRLLSGRTHMVTTGVCLIGPQHGMATPFFDLRSETSSVTFATLSHADTQFYISTGEPLDKAGAYAIQGIASRWITRIEGDYSNVVGLPVALVWRMLKEHGVVCGPDR